MSAYLQADKVYTSLVLKIFRKTPNKLLDFCRYVMSAYLLADKVYTSLVLKIFRKTLNKLLDFCRSWNWKDITYSVIDKPCKTLLSTDLVVVYTHCV